MTDDFEPAIPGLRDGFLNVLLAGGSAGDFRLRGPALPGTVDVQSRPPRILLAVEPDRRRWAQLGQLRSAVSGRPGPNRAWTIEQYVYHGLRGPDPVYHRVTGTLTAADRPGPDGTAPYWREPGPPSFLSTAEQAGAATYSLDGILRQAAYCTQLHRNWTPAPAPDIVADTVTLAARAARHATATARRGEPGGSDQLAAIGRQMDQWVQLLQDLHAYIQRSAGPDPRDILERLQLTVAAAAELTATCPW